MSTPLRHRAGRRVSRIRNLWTVVAVTMALVIGLTGSAAAASSPAHPSASPTAPVDLATPVDWSHSTPPASDIVRSGHARIEVLSPTLLRLEYSPTGMFEDSPTVNAVNRRMGAPDYRVRVSGGWLTLQTSRTTLRYRVGSGPFSAANTSVRLAVADGTSTVQPTWDWECPFDQTCQAGAASLTGGAALSQNLPGYQSSAGYVGYLFRPGAAVTWKVLGAPAGPAQLSVRYTNGANPLLTPTSTIDLVVNGRRITTLAAAPTTSATPWSTLTTTAPLQSGTNSVQLVTSSADNLTLGIDSLSVGPANTPTPTPAHTDPLGGWIRGFDTSTYGSDPTCPAGSAGSTCLAPLEPLHTDGLLDGAGWRLLDDTRSGVWNRQGWVQPRPSNGDAEDGYLFAYGHDYAGALHTLARLTGPAPLLPRSLFGVWYSDFTPYSSSAIESSLQPAFAQHGVPLDTLSLDTDWKAPNSWNGWEWDPSLFPDPGSFLRWAKSHAIGVTLNIHSSIQNDDPKLPAAQRIAGTTLATSNPACSAGPCKVWDWSKVPQAESNFALQRSFEQQGVAFWWLDWCCDESTVTMPGLTPDSWIGHLYAQQMVNGGNRGFVLARVGSSNDYPEQVYPAGPWSDHTSAIAFTGDAWGTWNTLAREAALTPDEATIGEPYVSDDIGSFLGPPPRGTQDPPDLYARWVQLGTFQPILRLHSFDQNRLPWQYPQPVAGIASDFLRLREALVPYTYTLVAGAHTDGLPMTRPLYLDYPDQAAAYANPGEYLYGPDMLVAPVTAPGSVADTTVWFPPGRWVDYFTGATFTGPSSNTLSVPLGRMPVFVRAGGIIPEQSASAGASGVPTGRTVLKVFSGSPGSFNLYGDSGTGLGYTTGASTETSITDSPGATAGGGRVPASHVTIGPARGHYPGEPASTAYQVEMIDLTRPTQVTLNGRPLDEVATSSTAAGWYYRTDTQTVVIDTPARPASGTVSVIATGAAPVDRSEPVPSSS